MPSKVIFANGNPFVLALMDALGLPKNTVSFEMRCALDEVVTVRCTYLPQADAAEGFDARPLLANYRLVPTACTTEGDPAEAFVDERAGRSVDTGRPVQVVQHINVEGRSDQASILAAIQSAKDAAVAEIKANLIYGRNARGMEGKKVPDPRAPIVPQPQPVRGGTAISAAAVGWGIFGMLGAGAALSYALGLWP